MELQKTYIQMLESSIKSRQRAIARREAVIAEYMKSSEEDRKEIESLKHRIVRERYKDLAPSGMTVSPISYEDIEDVENVHLRDAIQAYFLEAVERATKEAQLRDIDPEDEEVDWIFCTDYDDVEKAIALADKDYSEWVKEKLPKKLAIAFDEAYEEAEEEELRREELIAEDILSGYYSQEFR